MTVPTEPTLIAGRYLLHERIARGGSADVWRGHDQKLDRPVAVKLLHPHLVPDEQARHRLAEEGRLAASLIHERIVQVHDVLTDGETPALVMELVNGESLDKRLRRDGALPPKVAAGIGADVAEALAEAHRQGIIHRDVKPSNILIDHDGRARLGDFGIAHSLAPDVQRLTMAGTVVGTLAYIAPEQLAGGEVGPRTDLFGLGVVLFEMLTGHPPFDATSPLTIASAHAEGPPEMPGIDPALADITRACLAAASAARPPDADQVAAILRSIPAMSPAAREADTRAIPVVPTAPAAGPGGEPGVAWWRRLAPLAAAAGILAVVAIAIALGPGDRSAGAPGNESSPTPTPAWMTPLTSAYADACNATLDPAEIAGLAQPDAEARVAALITDCATAQASPSSGNAPGKGKGRDKGH